MPLPAREQQVLDGIETVLQSGEDRLTSLFALFTRLEGNAEKPGAEELRPALRRRTDGYPPPPTGRHPGSARWWSPSSGRWATSGPGGQLRVVILLAMMAAALGSAMLLCTISTSACRPVTVAHSSTSAPSQPGTCQSSPSAPPDGPTP
jgi:hypothetical protein